MSNLTNENLVAVMQEQLKTFNNEGVTISNETKHSEVLSKNDGFKNVGDSATLYKGAIMWTVWANGGKKGAWPAKWIDLTVQELANHIMSKQNPS